jgi:hypothetical protein
LLFSSHASSSSCKCQQIHSINNDN